MSEAYSRLYHRFSREFPEIYADDHAFSTWMRLLLLADASWPMRPPLPRSVRARVLACLQGSGLVIVAGDTYTVLGLDAERTRRRNAALRGSDKRWQSGRSADADAPAHASADAKAYAAADATAMPRRVLDETSTRRDERDTPPPPAERGRRKDGTNPRANGSAPRAQGSNPRTSGTSTRQIRADQKRGPTQLGAVLRSAMTADDADSVAWLGGEDDDE